MHNRILIRSPRRRGRAASRLKATRVFISEAELREAMHYVQQRLAVLASYTDKWLDYLDQADMMVFESDRDAWAATYRELDPKVAAAVFERMEDERPGEDDDGNAIAPSPRWGHAQRDHGPPFARPIQGIARHGRDGTSAGDRFWHPEVMQEKYSRRRRARRVLVVFNFSRPPRRFWGLEGRVPPRPGAWFRGPAAFWHYVT